LLDRGLTGGQLVNVNIPDLTEGLPVGVRVVPQATRAMSDKFTQHTGPDGRDYYWLASGEFPNGQGEEDDLEAISDRYVAITPLQFDLTQYALLEVLGQSDWRLDVRREK